MIAWVAAAFAHGLGHGAGELVVDGTEAVVTVRLERHVLDGLEGEPIVLSSEGVALAPRSRVVRMHGHHAEVTLRVPLPSAAWIEVSAPWVRASGEAVQLRTVADREALMLLDPASPFGRLRVPAELRERLETCR